MRQPEEIFFKSALKKVLFLIEEHLKAIQSDKNVQNGATQVQDVQSMRQARRLLQSAKRGR